MKERNPKAMCENCPYWGLYGNGACQRFPPAFYSNDCDPDWWPATPSNGICGEHPDFFLPTQATTQRDVLARLLDSPECATVDKFCIEKIVLDHFSGERLRHLAKEKFPDKYLGSAQTITLNAYKCALKLALGKIVRMLAHEGEE